MKRRLAAEFSALTVWTADSALPPPVTDARPTRSARNGAECSSVISLERPATATAHLKPPRQLEKLRDRKQSCVRLLYPLARSAPSYAAAQHRR